MLHRIQIKSPISHDNGLAHTANGTEVLVDGKLMHGITSIYTEHSVDSIPEVTMFVYPSVCDVETSAELKLMVDVDSVSTAIQCIQFQMNLDPDFREGVRKNIEDVLEEHAHKYVKSEKLSEEILNRVFGLD